MERNFAFIGLIPVAILIIIGILVKYMKAYWLISGYSAMSSEKKKNVDIEGLGRFAGNVCFFIAGLIFAAMMLIYADKAVFSMILFVMLIPSIIYILIKAQKYDGNTSDENGRMKKSSKIIIGSISGFLVLTAIGVGVLIYFSGQPAEFAVENGILKISGMYGQNIPLNEIESIEIKDSMPEILVKTNGSDFGTMLKGYFKLKDIGDAKLFVDTSKAPLIYLNINSKLFIINCEDSGKTRELYNELKDKWQKSTADSSKLADVKVEGDFFKSGSDDSNLVELAKINDDIWVHTTYENYNGSRTPSNGVIAVTTDGLVLVDTPWTNKQTKELIKLTEDVFKKDIKLAIITHAHEDRIGGIDTLIENKVDVRSTSLTVKEAEKNGFNKPEPKLDSDPKIVFGDMKIETFYPGEGHTADNITVWFPEYRVLFGGCLIKSMDTNDIGNTSDANLVQWPNSLGNVLEKYPDAETVIPGHGKWGGSDLISHTIELFARPS